MAIYGDGDPPRWVNVQYNSSNTSGVPWHQQNWSGSFAPAEISGPSTWINADYTVNPDDKINTVIGKIHRAPKTIAETDVNTILESLDEVRESLQEVCQEVDSVSTDDDRPMQRELDNAVFYLDELISSLKKAKGGSK